MKNEKFKIGFAITHRCILRSELYFELQRADFCSYLFRMPEENMIVIIMREEKAENDHIITLIECQMMIALRPY